MAEYNLINRIKFHEGDPVTKKAVIVPYKLKYRNANGKLVEEKHETVGYGHKVSPGEKIPTFKDDEKAENYFLDIFKKDLATAKQQAKTLLKEPNKHPPRVLDLLTEMVFQLGIGSVRGFDTTLADINKGNYDLAAGEMLLGEKENTSSKWHTQTPKRAEEISAYMKEQYVPKPQSKFTNSESQKAFVDVLAENNLGENQQFLSQIESNPMENTQLNYKNGAFSHKQIKQGIA
tara:strand:+ start:529 stop:1227 length:699 start_codon:yes stop_codon:yes gene_type:complete